MTAFMLERISVSPKELKQTDFEVIVIGSGYGGSIAAAHLSKKATSLCLLERGNEILPGEYPRNLEEVTKQTEIITSANGKLPNGKNGMMQLRINEDVQVVLGNGLGGGSLINAGVALEPDARVFRDGWPEALKDMSVLQPFMDQAKKMLGSQPLPDEFDPPKLRALAASAKAMGQPVERPPINVTFEDGENAVGVWQAACNHCGDCCSGCNSMAKNTLLMNYLPLAHQRKAEIVTQADARTVTQLDDGRYEVTFRDLSSEGAPALKLTADVVILAAGSIGSTEILQRSAAESGLPVSHSALGTKFSGNGDALGFGFMANYTHSTGKYTETNPPPVYGIGAGENTPDEPKYQPGPCITGVIKVNMTDEIDLSHGLVIEEGVPPGSLAAVYPGAFLADEVLEGADTIFPDIQNKVQSLAALAEEMQSVRSLKDMAALCYSGPMARSQTFLVMSHDTSAGKLKFDSEIDVSVVDWPGVGTSQPFPRDNKAMELAAEGIWASFLPNPIWTSAMNRQIVTVHPVGGCPMSDDPETGVVDDLCRVWTGNAQEKHKGLFVCDGSVIPTSLGINPLLTISAISERAVDHLHQNHPWKGEAPIANEKPVNSSPPPLKDTGVPEKLILHYLNIGYDKLLKMRMICHEPKIEAAPKLVFVMNELLGILGIEGVEKYLEDLKFLDAFIDNRLDKDLGVALEDIAKRLAAVIGAGTYPPKGTEPLIAMAKTLTSAFGDLSPGLSFEETMKGSVGPARKWAGPMSNVYDVAAKGGMACVANLKVDVPHALRLMDDKPEDADHDGKLSGEIVLTHDDGRKETFPVIDGWFDLLKQDEAEVECWTMTYGCQLGETYQFHGQKTLKRREGSSYYNDVTTLYVDLTPLENVSAAPLQGVLTLGLPELAKQLGTLDGHFANARPVKDVLADLRHAISDNKAKDELSSGRLLPDFVSAFLAHYADEDIRPIEGAALNEVAQLFTVSLAAVFAKLIFRTYGGITAYSYDFPARADVGKTIPSEPGDRLPGFPRIKNQTYPVPTGDGKCVKLYRFKGGTKGPVLLASGFGTTALSYGMMTNETSLLAELLRAQYDVWLFDYRSSPLTVEASLSPFNLDDIAKYDWPAAIDVVLKARKEDNEPVADVQVLGHCVGSMSLQMSLLGGYESRVRQMILSQLTVHPVTNWFNQFKSDGYMARFFADGVPDPIPAVVGGLTGSAGLAELLGGIDTIDMNSDPNSPNDLDTILNVLAWKVPFPYAEPCYSPCCHRIFGVYGPAFMHSNLNEATHNAIKTVFGKVSTEPFKHLALIMRQGKAVDVSGADVYLPNVERLRIPTHFVAGAKNLEFLPDTSLRTITWLNENLSESSDLFTRKVYMDFAHMDCFIGKANPNPIFTDVIAKFDELAAG